MEAETLLAMKNTDPKHINQDGGLPGIARDLLAKDTPAMLVSIVKVKGSTPRDPDAAMLVTAGSFSGTIGGGQLEWIALKQARKLLAKKTDEQPADVRRQIPLGPEIGQCCGGQVELRLQRLAPAVAEELEHKARLEQRPKVQIHGAGHTGKALAKALSLLPFDITVVDGRKELLDGLSCRTIFSALPEQEVRSAEPGTAFVILTHDHQQDFLLTGEALQRGDAAYVGMIGSSTKRSVFTNWLEDNGYQRSLADNLTCPIGGTTIRDKRPEMIAALVAAELIGVFSGSVEAG